MNFKNFKTLASAVLFSALAITACKKDKDEDEQIIVKGDAMISGEIKGQRVLSADTTYTLVGYVRVLSGGSLTIPAGTTIKGQTSSKAALIVERGGKIYANGTAAKPVVFTSEKAVGERKSGDWAGIIICGNSKVNTVTGTAQYESGVLGADVANYGGGLTPNLTDNSGVFKYVRIEFAGYAIQTDKEINGLTLCGVGSGTEVHHVQVTFGGDDAFEFFGGSVNATHLVAFNNVDDDFDMDQGFTGKLQFGISVKDPIISDAAGTSRGIELENKAAVSNSLYSRPVISNFTFVGPGTDGNAKHGATVHLGLNSRIVLANSIIVNAKTNGIEVVEDVAASLSANTSQVSNNIVFGTTANYALSGTVTTYTLPTLTDYLTGKANATVANLAAVGFTSTSLTSPNLTLATGSVAKTKASFAGTDLSTGFEQVAYAGAMDTNNWTSGWANFNFTRTASGTY